MPGWAAPGSVEPSTNTSRFHQHRRGPAMMYLRKSAHVTRQPVGRGASKSRTSPVWAITVPNWCPPSSHRTRRVSRASNNIVVIHARMRHSLRTRQTYASAAKRGYSHHHITRATCETRACKSSIVIEMHFSIVALVVDPENTEHVSMESV